MSTQYITIKRGDDGFGSQLMSIISGIAYSIINDVKYVHTPINNFKLLNSTGYNNTELGKCNDLINEIISNLGLKMFKDQSPCLVYPFFHDIIKKEGADKYYTPQFIEQLQKSYPYEKTKPNYYANSNTNIAIHVRRGNDLIDSDKPFRWIDAKKYDVIMRILNSVYKNPVFHIFSWGESGIINENMDVVYHESSSSEYFLDDFNGLVHSDVLVIGSSSFSWSAGMFNKKIVLCNSDMFKLVTAPVPSIWYENFERMCEVNSETR